MARYHMALNRAGVNAANTVLAELRCASSSRAALREFGCFIRAAPATAPVLVLARPSNTPAGGTNNVPLAGDAADGAALSSFYTTGWTTTPTFTTAGPFIKIAGLPLTVGAGFIWAFGPQDLVIPTSGSLLFANLIAAGATLGSFDIYFDWDE